jgi:hypothetical protein
MYQKTIGVSAALLLPRLARNHAAGSVADGSAPRGSPHAQSLPSQRLAIHLNSLLIDPSLSRRVYTMISSPSLSSMSIGISPK